MCRFLIIFPVLHLFSMLQCVSYPEWELFQLALCHYDKNAQEQLVGGMFIWGSWFQKMYFIDGGVYCPKVRQTIMIGGHGRRKQLISWWPGSRERESPGRGLQARTALPGYILSDPPSPAIPHSYHPVSLLKVGLTVQVIAHSPITLLLKVPTLTQNFWGATLYPNCNRSCSRALAFCLRMRQDLK